MRRFALHTLLVCAAAAAFSCNGSQPDPAASQPQNEIGFSTDLAQTRGIAHSTPNTILSLGVFGYSTGEDDFASATGWTPNLFENRKASRKEEGGSLTSWEYTPVVYWPFDLAVKNTFFAYSPYAESVADPQNPGGANFYAYDDGGTPYVYYSVPGNVNDHIDLLYSEPKENVTDINFGSNEGKVPFNMKHAMIWVRFLLVADRERIGGNDQNPIYDDNACYVINQFVFDATNIITGGRFDMAAGKWAEESEGNMERDHAEYVFDTHINNEYGGIMVKTGIANSVPLTASDENSMMIVPQNIVQKENGTNVWFIFTYHEDYNSLSDQTEYYITLPFPDVKLSTPGAMVTYVVKLSRSGSYIKFHSENTIEEWLKSPIEPEIEVQ